MPILLNRSECNLEHHPAVIRTITSDLKKSLCYYPPVCGNDPDLLPLLAEYNKLPTDRFFLGNGSNDLLRLVCEIVLGHSFLEIAKEKASIPEVVTFFPTYIDLVKLCRAQGAKLKLIRIEPTEAERAKLHQSREKHLLYQAEITPQTRLIYVCSPNNPIDFSWSPEEVAALCEQNPHCLILVDQAYYEFQRVHRQLEEPDEIASWVGQRYKNLVVTRTFSKAFALAGLRLGYLMAHPDFLKLCRSFYENKQLNNLALKAGQMILHHRNYYETNTKEVLATQHWLVNELNQLGLVCGSTETNFIIVDCGSATQATALAEYCRQQGTLLKDIQTAYDLPGYLRVAISTRAEMELFLKQVIQFLEAI